MTVTDILSTAERLSGELAKRAGEVEANRFLPQDIAAKFAEAGFYRLCIPEECGGFEANPRLLVETVERLARGDASPAWCVMIGATTGLLAGFMPTDEAQAVFGSADVVSAGVFAPRGKAVREVRDGVSGYRATGRWQWGSGSRNATWIAGGCLIMGDDGKPEMAPEGVPQNRMLIFPKNDVTLLDTWDVSGLNGTGSTDFEVKDVFVPESRAISLISDKPLQRPLYAFPTFGLLSIGIAGVALGAARGAIDDLVEIATAKKPQGSSKTLAERAKAHLDVSEAEALVRSARAYLYEAIDGAWDAASQSGVIAAEHRRDLRHASVHATKSAAKAIDLMYTLAGGSSVYRSNSLQRRFRDIHVATQHAMVADATYELTGRLFLGVPTNTAML